MSTQIITTGVHHIRLIVTDPFRSRDFYTSMLNFTVAAELPPGFVLTNGKILLGMTSPWDESQALPNDRFSPNRVGLDQWNPSVPGHFSRYLPVHFAVVVNEAVIV